jgi:hypothetical protein
MKPKRITIEEITKHELVMVFSEDTALQYKPELNVYTDKSFVLVVPSTATNWARMMKVRYYANATVPSDAIVHNIGYAEYQSDRIVLGDLMDIWTHPNFHMETYIDYHTHLLPLLPESSFSEQLCNMIVSGRSPNNIRYIPHKFITDELMHKAIDNRCSLSSIPEELLTSAIIEYALNKDMMFYLGVPKRLRTKEMEDSWNYYAMRRIRQGP